MSAQSPLARSGSVLRRWEAAARLVAEQRDVLDGRPDGHGGEPLAVASRGWSEFLLSLDGAELATLEAHGHDAPWPLRTPPDLRALARRAAAVCAVPSFPAGAVSTRPPRRGETPRKHAQIDAFGGLLLPLARSAARVVDVGSGHGHLTRELADRLEVPVVGLERDAALAGRARALSSGASPAFAVTDVLRDGLPLAAGDCVVGLHACGELGDLMVLGAARTRGVSVALVGCCLQKRRQLSRRPLCALDGVGDALELPRPMLGLSNLSAREEGVEATRAENLAARERRLALHRLLTDAGETLRLGAELEGLNRRSAQGELATLVARAFARRGRPSPSSEVVRAAARWAQTEHARARRLSLPRALLARALEVYVLLDRAALLEQHGLRVEVGALFPDAVSARNLALVAR